MRSRHVVVVTALVAGCSGSGGTATPIAETSPASSAAPTTTIQLAKATFTVQPGTDQIAVLGDTPGETLAVNLAGAEIARGTVDQQGSLLFRDLDPGDGYTVSSSTAISDAVTVADPAVNPPADFYSSQRSCPRVDSATSLLAMARR